MGNNKQQNLFLYGNVIFAVLIAIATILFMFCNLPHYLIKGTDSALFVLCGVFNLYLATKYYKNNTTKINWIMLLGLCLAFVGDILLIDYFIWGAIFFALGHICYVIYFCLLKKINWLDVVLALVIFIVASLIILLYPYFNFDGMLPLIIVYAFVISIMLGKAISNYIRERKINYLITMIGAILFFISDVMLLFNVFADAIKLLDDICLVTYYSGQYLLAVTIMLNAKNNNEIKS